jgi:hypothetical protein
MHTMRSALVGISTAPWSVCTVRVVAAAAVVEGAASVAAGAALATVVPATVVAGPVVAGEAVVAADPESSPPQLTRTAVTAVPMPRPSAVRRVNRASPMFTVVAPTC